MEIVGKKWRTAAGIGYQIYFAFGYMIMGGIAYIWRDWHDIMVRKDCSLPLILDSKN